MPKIIPCMYQNARKCTLTSVSQQDPGFAVCEMRGRLDYSVDKGHSNSVNTVQGKVLCYRKVRNNSTKAMRYMRGRG